MTPPGVLAVLREEPNIMLTIRIARLALAGLMISISSGQTSAAVNIPCLDTVLNEQNVAVAANTEFYRQFWAAESR